MEVPSQSMMRTSTPHPPKNPVCPQCKEKGTISYWKEGPKQKDLLGNVKTELVKLNGSRCRHCYQEYPVGQKFVMVY